MFFKSPKTSHWPSVCCVVPTEGRGKASLIFTIFFSLFFVFLRHNFFCGGGKQQQPMQTRPSLFRGEEGKGVGLGFFSGHNITNTPEPDHRVHYT